MKQSIFTEDFKAQPFWWDATPRPAIDEQTLPRQVDVLIIGSGYTGLNCALETSAGGMDTLVIDAESAGWGCSSRNGGQISGEIKPDYAELKRKFGEKPAFDLLKGARNALEWLGEFIHAQAIDCEFRQCGRFQAAHNPAQFKKLVHYANNQPKGLEQPLFIVERKDQASEIDSEFYHGGLVIPGHCSLDPAKYHQGLLQLATDRGCRLVSDCEALDIERGATGFSVTTS
jgi:glycine/D-amino acid oxidase-like deaminating enzyme